MTRRLVCLAVCFVCCMASLTAPALADAPRPNIVVILVDDMGYSDIGCYGSEIETPHIDKLAANGLRFTQFYNYGLCEDSRFGNRSCAAGHFRTRMERQSVRPKWPG